MWFETHGNFQKTRHGFVEELAAKANHASQEETKKHAVEFSKSWFEIIAQQNGPAIATLQRTADGMGKTLYIEFRWRPLFCTVNDY